MFCGRASWSAKQQHAELDGHQVQGVVNEISGNRILVEDGSSRILKTKPWNLAIDKDDLDTGVKLKPFGARSKP